jgi:hypothetical protein
MKISAAQLTLGHTGTCKVDLQVSSEQRYTWIGGTLKRTGYFKLRKKDKAPVLEYMLKLTGYCRQHLTKLIAQYRKNKWIGKEYPKRNSFERFYTREDVLLLATTDAAHGTLTTDAKGKEKKIYKYKNMMTPYDKLKSLSDAKQYLKPGITFAALDKEASRYTDLEAAKLMQNARKKLYSEIFSN